MAEDTEKRFQSIMNKLFNSPKSKIPLSSSWMDSSPSAQKTVGQKRPFSAMQSNLKGNRGVGGQNVAQAPPCRPWDRGDLVRRLSTFKSMRWFAKPKAVDAVNCARRGWVNVDMDIIACEICGARLQFSTPAWNQQQVEKAALVFSLKLESGHKLLCPWIDNSCDEKLASFAPMAAPVLVDHYKERSSELLQLSALPVISGSVFEKMRSPQLEHFLKQLIAVECGAAPNDSSWTEFIGNDVEVVSSDLYYQAHRILSLCGWEPRLLSYVVDCEHQSNVPSNGNVSSSCHVAVNEQNNRLSVYVSGSSEITRVDEDPEASSVYYDPNSTVLDCKLCGASIGLWAFATVPRPLELVRVAGYADVAGGGSHGSKSSSIENLAHNGKNDLAAAGGEATSSRKTMLDLTIAGGPTPAKQNFRARISIPIIGRSVRTRLSYSSSNLSTDEEVHKSLDTAVEDSTKQTQVEETDSGICGTRTQDDLPSTPVDNIANSQGVAADDASLRKVPSLPSVEQKINGVEDMANTASQTDGSTLTIEKEVRPSSNKKMEFDPIRQHRHFCPWVTSAATVIPGWQQTLSALQKEKVFSAPELEGSPTSPSLIKVDDPITSIRKLFESPPAKRPKSALK